MMRGHFRPLKTIVFMLGLALVPASAAPITGSVGYLGGALGTWSIQFASIPGVELQQVSITLPSTSYFDTVSGGPGLLLWQDFQKISGGAAASVTPGTAAGRDGATALTIGFTGFNSSAGTFAFLLDVDQQVTLQNCSGLPLGQAIACGIANTAATTAGSVTTGTEIAGTMIGLTFGGAGYEPLYLSTTLGRTGELTAAGQFAGEIPEPATYAMMGSALVALAVWRRRARQ